MYFKGTVIVFLSDTPFKKKEEHVRSPSNPSNLTWSLTYLILKRILNCFRSKKSASFIEKWQLKIIILQSKKTWISNRFLIKQSYKWPVWIEHAYINGQYLNIKLTKFLLLLFIFSLLAFLEIFVFYDYLISGFSFTLARKLCFFLSI